MSFFSRLRGVTGWPAVAQTWLMENHFWDGKITEEEVIGGFYLVPASSTGGRRDNEWRLSFARSEVQMKKCIPPPFAQAFQACKALVVRLLSRPRAVGPYHLRTLVLWACDRLPPTYLSQEENRAAFLLGLLDDMLHCLLNKTCPNYFIPQCNMFEHLPDDTTLLLARKLACTRADPAEHLCSAIEHARAASAIRRDGRSCPPSGLPCSQSDGALSEHGQDHHLARKLQQLVTENPGKSISVFLNPDDVTKPHFRIDDKFF